MTDKQVLHESAKWTIAKCEAKTGHSQVTNSHFCHCTHVMYDSEKPNARRMPAQTSITESERHLRTKYSNASAERDALEQNAIDAWATLAAVDELNLEQSLAGAIFDALRKVEKRVAKRCAEIAFDADTNHDAKAAILKEYGVPND